ncbi:MAG: hypothetical protein JXR79_09165 [Nitrospirae bacterium]|nr:hypothetical protein [Nitrospirota bacterium]
MPNKRSRIYTLITTLVLMLLISSSAFASIPKDTASLGSGNILSGAVGSGASEAAAQMTAHLGDDSARQIAAAIIGAAAAKATGGNAYTGASTAIEGEKNNRQLHQSEIDRAKKYARQFKEWVKQTEGIDITEEEAEGRLMRQMLRWADYQTAKSDDFRQDQAVTSFLGKNSIKVTEAEYYNPNINMDIRQHNLESYAKGEAQSQSGLTPQQIKEKNRPYEVLGKTAIAAGTLYILAPSLVSIASEVAAFVQSPLIYCTTNPTNCTKAIEESIYTIAGVPNPTSTVSNIASTEAKAVKAAASEVNAASSAADALRLRTQLAFQEAGVLTQEGKLTAEAIQDATRIRLKDGVIQNPSIVKTLTQDGSKIEDWAKYYTRSVSMPNGQSMQIHFYQNIKTGKIDYSSVDYKVKEVVKP